MVQQGWAGFLVPEQHGGRGGSVLDLSILAEEMGAALAPTTLLLHCVAVLAVLETAAEEQKRALLPILAKGTQRWTPAFIELPGGGRPGSIELLARREGDGYAFHGPEVYVRGAEAADVLLVPARTGNFGDEQVSLFTLDATAAGLSGVPSPSATLQPIALDGVRIPAASLLGVEHGAWPSLQRVFLQAAVLECAYMTGLSSTALGIALAYAKERSQFGRPVWSFQAIQHRAADAATDAEGCRLLTRRAAWAISQEEAGWREHAHVAKAWVSEGSRRIVTTCLQMHGGLGFTEASPLHRYFRAQQASERAYGDAAYHRARLADLLGV
jgi:alkylation response protein AidB-like acyl-CoA dehydrogenase